jgi:hypothetical protein
MLKTTKLLSAIVLLVTALLFNACSDSNVVEAGATNDVSTSIPADASGVFLMNVKSMMEKSDYAAFQETEVFAEFLKEVEKETPALVPFIKDPASAGIDLGGNMGMYFKANKEIESSTFAMLMPVGDVEKAKAAVKVLLEEAKKANKDGDEEITTTEKEGYTLHALGDDIHIVQGDRILAFTSFGDDAQVKALVAPEGNGIRDNAKYTAQVATDKDMVYWMDIDPLVEAVFNDPKVKMRVESSMALASIKAEGLKNNSLSGFNHFLDDKSEGELSFSFSDELKKELGDLVTDKMAVNYASYLPQGNLGAAFSFGVNGKGVLNFLTKRGIDATVDQQLSMLGLSLGDINEGITGDLAAGVYPPAAGSTEPAVVIALGLKDKAFMEKLMGMPPLSMLMVKEGENYVLDRGTDMMGNTQPKFYAKIVDDALVVSNDATLFEQALGGKTNSNIEPLQEGWLGMFVDYTVIAENFDVLAKMVPAPPTVLSQLSNSVKYQTVSTAYIVGKGETLEMLSNNKDGVNALKSGWMTWNQMHKDGVLDMNMNDAMEDEMEDFEAEFEEATEEVEQM